MSSSLAFVRYVCEQLRGAGEITHRPMFGEYGLYGDGKFFALVCDDQLFLKPTSSVAQAFAPPEAPPYDGAKPYFVVEALDDAAQCARMARMTLDALPYRPPKAQKTPRAK